MALVLDTTIGGPNANSYLTLAEAAAYFESRLWSSSWASASDTDKTAALVWATRLLDASIAWRGYVWSEQQALRWPRSYAFDADDLMISSDIIPRDVKYATAELAFWLLKKDRTAETGREGIRAFSVGKISFDFDKMDVAPTIPDSVYQLVAYLGELVEVSGKSGISVAKLVRT